MKRLFHNIVENPLHLLDGIVVAVIGYRLMMSKDYFFWPPNLIWLFNDDALGFFGLITGIGLIIYALRNKPNLDLNTLLLSCSAGFMAVLAVLELGHGMFMGAYRMSMTGYLEAAFVVVILYTARHSDYKHYVKRK